MWGRAIGIVFLVPAAAFTLKGWFDRPMKRRMGLAAGLLLFQVGDLCVRSRCTISAGLSRLVHGEIGSKSGE